MSSPFELPQQFNFPSLEFDIQNTKDEQAQHNLVTTSTSSGFVRPLSLLGNENMPPGKIQKKTQASLTQEKATCKENSEKQKTTLTLPRDTLLVTSRSDFDAFVLSVTNGRKLTKEERKEVARQRQLIKNRNTAAASRKRKKEYQSQLETKCADLTKSDTELRERLAALEAENAKMKNELSYFHNLVASNSVTSGILDSLKAAKKQFSMATPTMITTAKYILLFLLLLQFAFAFSMSPGAQIPLATKGVEWYTPVVDSFADAAPPQLKEDFSSSSASASVPWLPEFEEQHVPTLMPSKQEAQYEPLPSFTEQMQNENEFSVSAPFIAEKPDGDFDFESLNIDELLANSNGTLAFSDAEQLEYWENLFSSIATESSLDLCHSNLLASPNCKRI